MLRKQAVGLVCDKKQQRQLQEEIRWSQVESSVIFSCKRLITCALKRAVIKHLILRCRVVQFVEVSEVDLSEVG